jgi:hypothetical protein
MERAGHCAPRSSAELALLFEIGEDSSLPLS